MAEAIVSDIVAAIIAKLGSSVLKEIGLSGDLKDELKKLNKTIAMIWAVLHDAEKQSLKNEQIKTWLADLKEVAYDAEDLVDLYSTQALRKQTISNSKLGKKVRIFFSRSNQILYGHKMAHKIKSIREKIDEIYKNKTFMLDVSPVENVGGNTRDTHSSLPHVFVGRENDKKEIMKVLLSPDSYQNNVPVISIVGIGGLGKTTLAQLLLDDEAVKSNKHFDLNLWVCVGENFEIKSIVQKILGALKSSIPQTLELESLKNRLFESINGRRFVLVLDDVWNENPGEWFALMDLLAGGAEGSKIILTTRHRNVAIVAQSVLVYQLEGLSDDVSWDLLREVAFAGGDVPSSGFKEIGKEIVEKLNGVPLVIKTIGGFLYSKKSEDEWRTFKDGELSTVTHNDILQKIRLSYNHLPSHLQRCFTYCGLFPKDYKIRVHTMIDLWIAQGFVRSSSATQTLKDTGLQYFRELLWGSFFQEVEEDDFGDLEFCKMHDLMHDLAISVIGGELISSNSNGLNVDEKTRHISFDVEQNLTLQDFLSLRNANKARTFLLVNKSEADKDVSIDELWDLIFDKLKCLRALDLHGVGMETVPHSINKLELLTYLDLSYNMRMKKLPNLICRLLNLQVLKVDHCKSLEELPKDIWKLVKLRCLSMIFCHNLTHMPRGIGRLTGLETLSTFVVDKKGRGAELSELNNLKNLRGTLSIQNLTHVKNPKYEFQALNLKDRQHILKLELIWDSPAASEDGKDIENDEMVMDVLQPHGNVKELALFSYKGAQFSSWFFSLTTLVRVVLLGCTNIKRLPPFHQIPSLKLLFLLGLNNLEDIDMGISSNNGSLPLFFPSLNCLAIGYCPNLKGWEECSGIDSSSNVLPHFPCLSSLFINDCPNLFSVPPSPSINDLRFEGKSMKQLEQILKSNISFAEHNSSSPLSQLKVLGIKGIDEKAVLAEEMLQKFPSLMHLHISSCPGIVEMETPLFGQRSLQYLVLEDMESLPNWLRQLTSLDLFQIKDCPNLQALPEWIRNLTSLRCLLIENSPKLSQRCKNMDGEEWPMISHIPNIIIDYSEVQWNGLYINK